MEAEALSQRSKSLQSLAAEETLLAHDAVSGKTSRIYTREHSSELSKAASQAEASLKASKTEPVLEPKLRQLARVTGLIAGKLGILERYRVGHPRQRRPRDKRRYTATPSSPGSGSSTSGQR